MSVAPVLQELMATAPVGLEDLLSKFVDRLAKAGVISAAQLQVLLGEGVEDLIASAFPEETFQSGLSGGWGFPEARRSGRPLALPHGFRDQHRQECWPGRPGFPQGTRSVP